MCQTVLIVVLCHIAEHKDEMAYAAGHDEEMEYFVSPEKWETAPKHFELKGVYDTADCIKESSDKEP